jgi:hypothetical protein
LLQIVEDLTMRGPHTALGTATGFAVDELMQPTESSIVDCLSYVKAKIEAAVVTSAQHKHELPSLVLRLVDLQLRVLLFQVVRIYKCSLMPQMLTASAEVLWEVCSRFPLQQVRLLVGNGIPEFRFAFMEVVDGG